MKIRNSSGVLPTRTAACVSKTSRTLGSFRVSTEAFASTSRIGLCPGSRKEAEPIGKIEIFQAWRFGKRGRACKRRQPLFTGDRYRLQVARFHQRHDWRHARNRQLNVPAYRIRHGWRGAAIWDVRKARALQKIDVFAGKMMRTTHSW